ncbi:MAG TPA: hypothetical protein DCR38_03905 [Butyricimonas virosa]|jgi:transcriptional regulator with XRE-family HTH domain|nr:hypothetical protein [Butyricimonas virosa]
MNFNQEAVIKRIKEIQSSKLMNQKEFAELIHVNQPDLSSYLSGKKPFGMTLINRISLELSINKEWLLTGEGEMLLSNNPKIYNEDKSDNITLSREVFDLIKNQSETILSQQKTIENLVSKVKDSIVPREGNAMNADAAGFSDK